MSTIVAHSYMKSMRRVCMLIMVFAISLCMKSTVTAHSKLTQGNDTYYVSDKLEIIDGNRVWKHTINKVDQNGQTTVFMEFADQARLMTIYKNRLYYALNHDNDDEIFGMANIYSVDLESNAIKYIGQKKGYLDSSSPVGRYFIFTDAYEMGLSNMYICDCETDKISTIQKKGSGKGAIENGGIVKGNKVYYLLVDNKKQVLKVVKCSLNGKNKKVVKTKKAKAFKINTRDIHTVTMKKNVVQFRVIGKSKTYKIKY